MKTLFSLLLVAAVTVSAAPASALQLFDFDGQASSASVGEFVTAVTVINNNGQIETPLPLDFANFQYTLVVTDLRYDAANGSQDLFSGGVIRIYEDASTAADFGDVSTFTDGVVLLEGELATFERNMFGTLGAGAGIVNWTGGANIDDINFPDRLGWAFLVNVSRASSQVQPGWFERWDGKVEPQEPIVSNETSSWGDVKSRF